MKQMRFTYIYAIIRSIFLILFLKISKKNCAHAKMHRRKNETLPRKHVYLLFSYFTFLFFEKSIVIFQLMGYYNSTELHTSSNKGNARNCVSSTWCR